MALQYVLNANLDALCIVIKIDLAVHGRSKHTKRCPKWNKLTTNPNHYSLAHPLATDRPGHAITFMPIYRVNIYNKA